MNSTKSVPKTLEDLNSLKVAELRKYLRDNGQLTSGLKADLLLRCRFLIENPDSSSNVEPENTLVIASTSQNCLDVNVERLKRNAFGCSWSTDLRKLPSFDFVKLFDYLVVKTGKYEHAAICQAGYKKLKSYKFLVSAFGDFETIFPIYSLYFPTQKVLPWILQWHREEVKCRTSSIGEIFVVKTTKFSTLPFWLFGVHFELEG